MSASAVTGSRRGAGDDTAATPGPRRAAARRRAESAYADCGASAVVRRPACPATGAGDRAIVRGVLFDELVATVGPQRFQAACERAWQTAAGIGRCGGQRSFAGDLEAVPREFADAWWDGDVPLGERLDAALRLYAQMP